jgi:hypothetical protein
MQRFFTIQVYNVDDAHEDTDEIHMKYSDWANLEIFNVSFSCVPL